MKHKNAYATHITSSTQLGTDSVKVLFLLEWLANVNAININITISTTLTTMFLSGVVLSFSTVPSIKLPSKILTEQ